MNLDNNIRIELVAQAVRFAKNMIVEVIGNHSRVLSPASQKCLRDATAALSEFELTLVGNPETNNLEVFEAPTD